MKKAFGIALAALLIGGAAYAQVPEFRLSAGAGGLFGLGLGGGVEAGSGASAYKVWVETLGGGGFAFLDATFAEVAVSFILGSATSKTETGGTSGQSDAGSFSSISISALGKYPFALGPVSLYPLAGIEYQLFLSVKNEDGDEYEDNNGDSMAKEFNALWIRLGVGVDYPLTDALYLRGEILYGIRLANEYENDAVDSAPPGADAKALLGHGPAVKIAVGYRF